MATLFHIILPQLYKSIKINCIMFVDPERKAINTCIRFAHLALQIIAGYWAVIIDGYPCQEQFVKNVTYLAYAMLGFNALFFAFQSSRVYNNKYLYYLPFIVNLVLSALMLYFTIEGYNKYNNCAQSKALYEFFLIQIVISLVLFFLIIIAKVAWAERYAHWPGNLAWPILFLKWGFPGLLSTPALVIGIIYAIISILSFAINAFHYNSIDLSGKNANLMTGQWSLSMIFMLGCQILAIVMLIMTGKDGDYNWHYGRAIFVIFAAVNIIDFFFWFYGYRKL